MDEQHRSMFKGKPTLHLDYRILVAMYKMQEYS
jgi:hypothetical protein